MENELKNCIDKVSEIYRSISGLPCIYHDIEDNIETTFDTNIPCNFCNMILKSPAGCFQCRNQRNIAIQTAVMNYNWHVMVCHAGLLEWIVPVFHDGSAIGVFISGFVSNSSQHNREFIEQIDSYIKRYQLNIDTFLSCVDTLPVTPKEKVKPYAQLLFALTRLYISSGKSVEKKTSVPDTTDVFFFTEPDIYENPLPDVPLTHYILDAELDSNSLNVFWKTVEKQANNIFMNIMSGRIVEARTCYRELMQLALSEETLTNAKISAETLFHIIFLKYYKKSLYDVRFYRLAFTTIEHLYEAQSITQIEVTMMNSFDSLYSLFNAADNNSYNSSVTRTILKYLEENYQKNIKVEDIAKIVYLSPAYVSRLFKKETTFTIKWSLNNIRMFHAQQMLLNTYMPVKDISLAVGYTDIRGFYKMFAKHFGMTCSQMRKKYSNMK